MARDQLFQTDLLVTGELKPPLSDAFRRVGRQVVAWAGTCADYYAAAATYEGLSALSDVALMRRGLSRANLARDVCATCDREV